MIPTSDEAAVRAVIDALADAIRAQDVEVMLAHCAPELATFDLMPPLKHEGPAALRRLWAATLGAFVPPVTFDVFELEVFAGAGVAFTRSLNRFGGTFPDGQRVTNWMCATHGLRKVDGAWKVAHEHVSVPFDMATGKALLDLTP